MAFIVCCSDNGKRDLIQTGLRHTGSISFVSYLHEPDYNFPCFPCLRLRTRGYNWLIIIAQWVSNKGHFTSSLQRATKWIFGPELWAVFETWKHKYHKCLTGTGFWCSYCICNIWISVFNNETFWFDVSRQNKKSCFLHLCLQFISLCISGKHNRSNNRFKNENYYLWLHRPNITRHLKAVYQSLLQSLCLNCDPFL